MSALGSTVFALAQNRLVAGNAAKAMCEAFGARGQQAAPLVTTVVNSVPLGQVTPRSGPRYSIIVG